MTFDLERGVPEAVREHARNPDHLALVTPGAAEERHTYASLWARSATVAAALRARGVERGARVALAMSSRWETVVTLIAVQRLGATLVPVQDVAAPVPGDAKSDAVRAALRAGRARWCLVAEPSLAAFASALSAAEIPVRVLAVEPLLAAGSPVDGFVDAERRADDLLLIQFSSGSTAQPKGVCLTRGNVNAHLAAVTERLGGGAHDVTVSWLPLYHDMGLVGALLGSLWSGGMLVLLRPADFVRNPLCWLETVARYRGTITMGPQFGYSLCLARSQRPAAWERLRQHDLSSLRLALNGSETVHAESSRHFEERFAALGLRPGVLQPAYGLAENCVAVTLRTPGTEVPVRRLSRSALARGEVRVLGNGEGDAVDAQATVGNGRSVRGTRISIRDDDGRDLPAGRVGQIHIAGISATTAFCGADGEMRPVAVEGWVPTGDVGVVLDGELHVIGRIKEILKYGGRTFVPSDIEAALAARLRDDLGGVAAFGVYDATAGGEQLVVVAEPPRALKDGGHQALPERIRLCVLQEFQLPVRDVVLVLPRSIPRTSSGKIQRVRLRSLYMDGALAIPERLLHVETRSA
ncbi:MAG TPA: AMP-binding protein [Longimicrobium sp.]|jgi:acyl-CoA synthetase (AMP-forming)/AMP-acid ligase II